MCPVENCTYVAPIATQRPCQIHSKKLVKTNGCPVEFAYVYPIAVRTDHCRWLTGFVRQQKGLDSNLHNHPIHDSSKLCSKVKEVISNAAALNPSIRPSEIARGVGVPVLPGAIDKASNHIGKISREVHKAK